MKILLLNILILFASFGLVFLIMQMSRGDGMTKYQHDKIVRKTKEACAKVLRDHGSLLKRRGLGTRIYCREAADICMAAEAKPILQWNILHLPKIDDGTWRNQCLCGQWMYSRWHEKYVCRRCGKWIKKLTV